jgi:hypothetical protein
MISDILGWACVVVAIAEWVLIILMLPGYLRDRRRAAVVVKLEQQVLHLLQPTPEDR